MIPTRRAALAQNGHRFSGQVRRKENGMIVKRMSAKVVPAAKA